MDAGNLSQVVVVDDDADTVEVIALLLQRIGFEVATARNGREALRLAQEFAPRLVVLDIAMPEMDGYEVARKLRDNARTQDATLVAVTGYARMIDRIHCVEAEFDLWLTKPVSLEVLEQAAYFAFNAQPPGSKTPFTAPNEPAALDQFAQHAIEMADTYLAAATTSAYAATRHRRLAKASELYRRILRFVQDWGGSCRLYDALAELGQRCDEARVELGFDPALGTSDMPPNAALLSSPQSTPRHPR